MVTVAPSQVMAWVWPWQSSRSALVSSAPLASREPKIPIAVERVAEQVGVGGAGVGDAGGEVVVVIGSLLLRVALAESPGPRGRRRRGRRRRGR